MMYMYTLFVLWDVIKYNVHSLSLCLSLSVSLSLSLSLSHTHFRATATTPVWDSSTTKWEAQTVDHPLQGGHPKIHLSKGAIPISCNIRRVSPLRQETLKYSGGHKDLPLKVEISLVINSFVDVVVPRSEGGVALG
jgi:hypothetical protein